MSTLLEVNNLTRRYLDRSKILNAEEFFAVNNVSFTLNKGETLAIIGESGSGKSTLSKMLAGMIKPTSGEILFEGKALEFGDYRFRAKHIRMIFQDSEKVFEPNHNIGQILDTPLVLTTNLTEEERNKRIFDTLHLVGMYPEHALVPISEASSSQKQRIALARALILRPEIIIIDDTLSTLDFSIKTQLLNLMLTLQQKFNVAYIYIGQNLGIIKHISDNLLVMQKSEVVEYGNTKEILLNPQSKFTSRAIDSFLVRN